MAGVARRLDVQRPLARNGEPFGDYAEADDVCAQRRAGCGTDRWTTRADRRGAQLGLPLHVGARCVVFYIATRGQCASATAPRTSSSWTFTAKRSMPSTSPIAAELRS